MLTIGLLGCGEIARRVHLEALEKLPGVRVGALAERDPQRLEDAGRRVPTAERFADYRDLLARSDAEAVVVCLPPALHAEAAVQAFEAGRHVYLEKPIATTLDEARAVVEAGRKAGTVGMMGFNYRFGPLHLEAREQLRAGRAGQLVGARTVFSSAPYAQPAWKGTRQSGGGVLLDLASHHADLVRFLFEDEVAEVSAQLLSQESEHDSALVQMRLAGGLPVQSFFTLGSVVEDRFEVYGRAGKLSFDRHTSAGVAFEPAAFEYGRGAQLRRELRRLAGGVRRVLRAPGEPSFAAALTAFAEAAAGRRSDYPTLEDGYRSLAVLAAAERAASTGESVDVPTRLDGALA